MHIFQLKIFELAILRIASVFTNPKMERKLREIFTQSNIFWGDLENLLRADIASNRDGWNSLLSVVLEASRAIESRTYQLQDEITYRAKQLSESIA